MTDDRAEPRLSRRLVLKAALAAPLAAYPPSAYPDSATGKPRSLQDRASRFGMLHELAPGQVQPKGWLHLYLRKQAEGLAGHLPEVSWPFTGLYWQGWETTPGAHGFSWWPWEQKAYWIDGALRCALVLKDLDLMAKAAAPLDYTLSHVGDDGYIGPVRARDAHTTDPHFDNFRWIHTIVFRAMAARGDATGSTAEAAAMQRHYLADRTRTNYGGPSRDVTNVETMLWAFQHTGDARLLAMAETAWAGFIQSAPPGDRNAGDLHPDRVFSNAPIHAHGVTYSEQSKIPAILYMHTGKQAYLDYAIAAQGRIINRHMLVDGIPSTSEDYGATGPSDVHETCDISDHSWSWGYLLMATGDGIWADRIERAVFNAGFGAIRKDWKGVQYFSCPNQVIATATSSHVPFTETSVGWMAYRPNPGHETACCAGNVHRFLPNYVIRMWMRDNHNGVMATLYGASSVTLPLGDCGDPVTITQDTDYPFGETIDFALDMVGPVAFPLSLRIPAWCKNPRLSINGQPIAVPAIERGFVRLHQTFRPHDRITLTLPMIVAISVWSPGGDWQRDGLALEHGPLVYALPVEEHWTSAVDPKWSTADFPEWHATPASVWNYAVAVPEMTLAASAQLHRQATGADPWVNPPVRLAIPVKRVAGWGLAAGTDGSGRQVTPSLPTLTPDQWAAVAGQPVETAQLVPLGATHLRLTVFPQVYASRP